jgi:cysteine desulfurase
MSEMKVYLDNNATTPCDPRVVEAMVPYFSLHPGNAASRTHGFGWEAEEAVSISRGQIASLIGVGEKEIVFTSGATESINLALKGIFEQHRTSGNHIVTLKTEHKAVLDSCEHIEKLGADVTYLDVLPDGRIDLERLENSLTEKTILVSVMWANNETGVIQPMAEIGAICRKNGVLLMSDATQAVGKIPVDPREAGVDLMAFSAHKFYGPKGVGALYISRNDPQVRLVAQMDGGGHERGRRSGTLNVPGIVGMGRAAELCAVEMKDDAVRLASLRDRIERALVSQLEEVTVNGSTTHRLPHVTNLAFRHVDAETLIMRFNQEVAVSTGSACTSASIEPSHVLLAYGLDADMAHASLRISLGRFNTAEEIDYAAETIVESVKAMREISPVWQEYKGAQAIDQVSKQENS